MPRVEARLNGEDPDKQEDGGTKAPASDSYAKAPKSLGDVVRERKKQALKEKG